MMVYYVIFKIDFIWVFVLVIIRKFFMINFVCFYFFFGQFCYKNIFNKEVWYIECCLVQFGYDVFCDEVCWFCYIYGVGISVVLFMCYVLFE